MRLESTGCGAGHRLLDKVNLGGILVKSYFLDHGFKVHLLSFQAIPPGRKVFEDKVPVVIRQHLLLDLLVGESQLSPLAKVFPFHS
jgi:hypothetical protein